LNTLIPFTMISAVLIYSWMKITHLAGLVAFAALYGFFSGGIVALAPAAITTILLKDLSKLGSRMGMSFAICGLGILCGPPISGAIISSHQNYSGALAFAATVALAGSLVWILARIAAAGSGFTAKI